METRRSGDAAAASGGAAAPAADVAHGCLCTFFAQESATLLPSLRRYVLHAGLSSGRSLEDEVADLLQEVVVHALRAAGEFDVTRRPAPWVLGIAVNLIRRRRVEQAKQRRRLVNPGEPGAGGAAGAEGVTGGAMSADVVFDRFAAASENPEEFFAGRQVASSWLALVSDADRQVLQHAVLQGMDGAELAAVLQISAGAARVRLHRALQRLRAALAEQEEGLSP